MISAVAIQKIRLDARLALGIPELDSVPGLTWNAYYRFIYLLVSRLKLADCVELGVCTGRCTVHMALAYPEGRVYAVDPRPHEIYEEITRPYANIQLIRGSSIDPETLAHVPDGTIALCFADSVHNPDHVLREVEMWTPKMRDGGIFLFDDLLYAGMDRVLQEVPFTRKGTLHQLHHTGFGYAIKE